MKSSLNFLSQNLKYNCKKILKLIYNEIFKNTIFFSLNFYCDFFLIRIVYYNEACTILMNSIKSN